MNESLLATLSKNWLLLLLRGVFAVIFGLTSFAWPGLTISLLILMWGIYIGLDGLFAIASAMRGGSPAPRWWLILVGLLGILTAIVCIVVPGIALAVIVLLIGWTSIARGLVEIIGAISLRKEIEGEWRLIISGLLSIFLGLIFVFRPGTGALALIWLIATFAIMAGIALILLAFRLKKHCDA